ncbi:MAG: glycosidase [Patescibacteria group bacterium]|nr:glycosidase [Patescibacteria group bacterium]
MRLIRHPQNPILQKNPANTWEAGSVFNANVFYEDGLFRMLYRATNDVKTSVSGQYISSIGYAESTDGIHFERRSEPLITPDQPYEQGLGCEDPRVTKIGEEYFIYYTAVEWHDNIKNVRVALATTTDFKTVTKHGVVGPHGSRSKAAALLPEPVNGQYIWYYTWRADRPESTIMHARFGSVAELKKPPAGLIANTLEHYDEYAVLKPTAIEHDGHVTGVQRGPELGAPPIRTKDGWLFIYCPSNTEDHREWQINAALLDLNEPWKVLATTSEPILRPETPEELEGVVDHVTFPSGAVIVGEDLYVYYGSGDQGVCLATCKLDELLGNLTP